MHIISTVCILCHLECSADNAQCILLCGSRSVLWSPDLYYGLLLKASSSQCI